MDWKEKDWVEHSTFGIGRVGEDRGDRLDIDFVTAGRKSKCQSKHTVDRWNPQPGARRHLVSKFSGGPSSFLRPGRITAG